MRLGSSWRFVSFSGPPTDGASQRVEKSGWHAGHDLIWGDRRRRRRSSGFNRGPLKLACLSHGHMVTLSHSTVAEFELLSAWYHVGIICLMPGRFWRAQRDRESPTCPGDIPKPPSLSPIDELPGRAAIVETTPANPSKPLTHHTLRKSRHSPKNPLPFPRRVSATVVSYDAGCPNAHSGTVML